MEGSCGLGEDLADPSFPTRKRYCLRLMSVLLNFLLSSGLLVTSCGHSAKAYIVAIKYSWILLYAAVFLTVSKNFLEAEGNKSLFLGGDSHIASLMMFCKKNKLAHYQSGGFKCFVHEL